MDLANRSRALKAAGIRKLETPTTEFPFVLVIVDELADLTAYCPEFKLRARAKGALLALTSKGRAAGFGVLALAQDPSKDVVSIRNMFPTRIALRLSEPVEVGMVLGEGARAKGARADRIGRDLPGVGYVRTEDDMIRRFRAPFVTDNDIAALVEEYAPPAAVTT